MQVIRLDFGSHLSNWCFNNSVAKIVKQALIGRWKSNAINGQFFESQKLRTWTCREAFTWLVSLAICFIGFSINKMEKLMVEKK